MLLPRMTLLTPYIQAPENQYSVFCGMSDWHIVGLKHLRRKVGFQFLPATVSSTWHRIHNKELKWYFLNSKINN